MNRIKLSVSHTEPVKLVCRHCGTRYEYDREIKVEREAEPGREAIVAAEAEAELRRQFAEPDMAVVRCPSCRKYAPGALKNRLIMALASLVGAAIAAAICIGLILFAGATGTLFWLIALLAGLASPVLLLLALASLFISTTHTTRPSLD